VLPTLDARLTAAAELVAGETHSESSHCHFESSVARPVVPYMFSSRLPVHTMAYLTPTDFTD